MAALGTFYKDTPALWQVDYSWEGFQWIVPDDNQQSVIAFLRRDAKGHMLLVVCNFNPVLRENYEMGVPVAGSYKEILSSDETRFGGSGFHNRTARSRKGAMHGFEQHIRLTLPPLSTLYFSVPDPEAKPKKTAKPAKKAGKTAAAKATAKPTAVKAAAGEEKEAKAEPAPKTRGRKAATPKKEPAAKAAAEPKAEKAPAKAAKPRKTAARKAEEKS